MAVKVRTSFSATLARVSLPVDAKDEPSCENAEPMSKPILIVVLALLPAACTRQEPAPQPKPAPLVSGVELANFDKTVRPQDDFYRYVNGTWLNTTKIPADKPDYGSFVKLSDDSEARLRGIIEESAGKTQAASTSDEQKVGNLYASFMDEKKLDELGLKPLDA
jgi:putative endopeptidase